MTFDHNKTLAAEAKATLGPLGFQRQGRSRRWIADYGYWLGLVEFQPSSYSKGSYLNVGAHFLWSINRGPAIYVLLQDLRDFIEPQNEQQFRQEAARQARNAAEGISQLRHEFASVESTAAYLAKGVRDLPPARAGWPVFNAAVALGLAGETGQAKAFFDAVLSVFADWRPDFVPPVEQFARRVGDRTAFKIYVEEQIQLGRKFNKLPQTTISL